MSGRHSGTQPRLSPISKWSAIAVVVAVVAAGGYFGIQSVRASGADSCDSVSDISVAVDPTIASAVSDVVSAASAFDLGCSTVEVRAEKGSDTATELVGTNDNRPDLWIPDSTLWLLKTLRSTGALPEIAKTSVANTLPVLVSRTGEVPVTDTWLSVLQMPGQSIGDPLTSSASNAAILGALAESEVAISDARAVSAALVPMAQDFGRIANKPHDIADLVAQVDTSGGTAVATEQGVVSYVAEHSGAAVTASVPPTGSYFLNYPMAITAAAGPDYDRVKAAGAALASVLATQTANDTFLKAGFRSASGTPLADGQGVGSVGALELKNPLSIETTLRDWAVLALPLRTLVVEDVSGSMAAASGNSTRIALTVDASVGANALFSDQTQMGLWAFSIGLGQNGLDYRELVPMGPATSQFNGISQRDAILSAIRGLPKLVGGGTGLYDTTLAAFRRVKEGYDPKFVNSVIILTDGANEDANSPSLDTLLATLQREQDPVRPIVIVTVGITEDADPVALQQISAVTGGTSYIAQDPRDIPEVFVKALNSRTERMGQ